MIPKAFIALGAAVLLTGCAYTLGDARPSMMRGIETISVPVSKNTTLEPNVEGMLADTIVKHIQTDGTYTVTRNKSADAVLETTLSKVERKSARSVRGNVLATSEYLLRTEIDYRVTEQSTGRQLLNGRVTGTTSFFVSADLQTDEVQALPLAFSDAATKLASRLSEGF